MSNENPAPASGQSATPPASPVTSEFNNTVGVRSLDGREMQALYDRLEKNGTPLEEVNAITKTQNVEVHKDTRTDIERKFDARDEANETPEGYLPSLNLSSILSAGAPFAAVAEIEQHAAAFAHALQLPKATAGETLRQMVGEAVRVNSLSPEAKAAHVARSQAVLSKALGGPQALDAAIKSVNDYVGKAGNSDFAKHVDMAFTDPQTFLTLYHAAQRQSFRASRNR
jgi:hypothetical protein